MKKFNMIIFVNLIVMSLFFQVINNLYAASQPKFTLIPTTPTTLNVSANSSATVQYIVTNHTQITRTLTMVPILGISQTTTGAGVCANPFTLAQNQSCLLTLLVQGSLIPEHITQGPSVCKTKGIGDNSPDPFLCSQPAQVNSLNITRIGAGENVTITVTGSPLGLAPNGSPRSLTITNTSNNPAFDIAPNFSGTALQGNVTVTGNTCALLAPGASCTITFTPGANPVPGTFFPIGGSNTSPVSAEIAILAPGQLWQGGYVFAVNSNGSGKVYSTVDVGDGVFWGPAVFLTATNQTDGAPNTVKIIAATPSGQTNAGTVCGNYSILENGVLYNDWYLPANGEFNSIYANLYVGTPPVIPPPSQPIYWSSTEERDTDAFIKDLSNGGVSPTFKLQGFQARCARAFT